MHSCFTSSIFAARTLDFKVKFGFVFRSEAAVFRRYVLALFSVGLLRKVQAYLVYLSLIRSYSLGAFHFFKNSSILLICYYGFALSSPVFPRKLMTCAVVFQLCLSVYVRAHCYCASLVRTLFIGHARATSLSRARTWVENSTKYRADNICVCLVCEYFCWMLGDPHFFRQITSFSDSFHYTKKICTWEVLIISHIPFAPVPCIASVRSNSLKCLYHFKQITCFL